MNHSPPDCDLQAVLVFPQHLTWFFYAGSLPCLLLLRILYLTTLGPKMLLSNIAVKYSEENSVSGEFSKIGEHRIEIGRVRSGLGFYCYTHSLRRTAQCEERKELRKKNKLTNTPQLRNICIISNFL